MEICQYFLKEWDTEKVNYAQSKKSIRNYVGGSIVIGGIITAHASENSSKEPEHTCAFNEVYTFYRSEYKGYHPYQIGTKTDGSMGQIMPVYATCGVSVNYYKGEWKCGCGKTNGPLPDKSYEIHSGCGK